MRSMEFDENQCSTDHKNCISIFLTFSVSLYKMSKIIQCNHEKILSNSGDLMKNLGAVPKFLTTTTYRKSFLLLEQSTKNCCSVLSFYLEWKTSKTLFFLNAVSISNKHLLLQVNLFQKHQCGSVPSISVALLV